MADELVTVARRLLAIPPEGFVAARTAASRDARADDRERATAIGALRKPAPAAWVVNLLAGQDALDDAVELGPRLREAQAQADPATIRRLRAERRSLVESLVRAGAELADDAGHAVTDPVRAQVAATIEAAMADPWAGTAVRSGLLVRALESVGFERVDLEGAIAVPGAVDVQPDDPDDPDDPDPDRPADPAHEAPDPSRGGRTRRGSVSRASRPDRPTPAEQAAARRTAGQERRRDHERRREQERRRERERQRAVATAERTVADARGPADTADADVADLERQLADLERRVADARATAEAAHAELDRATAARDALTDG